MSRSLRKVKDSVISSINQIFKDREYPKLPIDDSPIQGDLSIICFPGAQPLKKSPEAVANEVAEMLSGLKFVKKTFIVKAFCNLVLDWDDLMPDVFSDIIGENFGRGSPKNKSILVEHTSANATGPFHMGRARNPIIGDSIARLLQYYGHDVETEYYVNDTGRQAATLAFGLSNYETKSDKKVDHELVEAYRDASKLLEEDENVRKDIYQKMEDIEEGNSQTLKEVKDSAKRMLEGMKISLKRLGAEANNYFHESDLIANGKTVVTINITTLFIMIILYY